MAGEKEDAQNAQLLRLRQRLSETSDAPPAQLSTQLPTQLPKDLADFFKFLQESEAQALALIAYVNDPTRTPPVVPPQGDVEVGFVLYWIHYPPPKFSAWLNEKGILQDAVRVLFDGLRKDAPPTRITPTAYNNLMGKIDHYGVPWDDGTLFGFHHYEQLDEDWIYAAINYAINVKFPDLIAPFPTGKPVTTPPTNPAPIPLTRKDGNTSLDPVIGIVGDWGTGYYTEDKENGGIDCPAKRVMAQMTGPNSPPVDYLIHLGDVYYAGTDWRPPPGEEQNNFYNLWPDQGTGRNFTLNSNHEMYGDGSGYFDITLQSPGKFTAQKGLSYFALTYGPWLILGLDSAYYSDAENGLKFYMEGAIGTQANDSQMQWIAQFRRHKGPIMIMTHHDACDLTGSNLTPLYNQVRSALQRAPTLWYWGHVHNAIVYKHLYDMSGSPVIQTPTKGRCCGHGAVPFGTGWALEKSQQQDISNILYFAHTPDNALPNTGGPKPKNPRVKNGYALVTLHKDGGFSEGFYETGNVGAVWGRRWGVNELQGEESMVVV